MAQRTRTSLDRAESGEATTTKSRRSHRKSRNGCLECKHRHIRCDERKPSCANCDVAERICSFLTPQVGKTKQKQGQRRHAKQQQQSEATAAPLASFEVSSHSNDNANHEQAELSPPVLHQPNTYPELDQEAEQLSRRSLLTHYSLPGLDANPHQIPSPASPMQLSDGHSPPSGCYPGLSTIPDVAPKAIFTPQHMILLHHADRVPNFHAPNRSAVDVAVRHIVGSPYLIDEVLAFTAFHMSHLYPGSAVYLQRLATELQSRALASFTRLTEMVPVDDKATAVPRFLFSAILGRHALAETLTYCHSDFHFFIDRFVECINLNRGVRAVTPPARNFLNDTEIEPFISVVRDAEKKIVSPGTECNPLSRLMDDSDLNEASIEACRQAIKILQWSFDLCRGLDVEEYPQSVSVFSVMVEAGFLDVLRKHQPEALVILAYYGVLLYRCRSFWAFGDAGAAMIRAITGRLGTYWQEALAWPLHVLETERNSELLTEVPGGHALTMPLHGKFPVTSPDNSDNLTSCHASLKIGGTLRCFAWMDGHKAGIEVVSTLLHMAGMWYVCSAVYHLRSNDLKAMTAFEDRQSLLNAVEEDNGHKDLVKYLRTHLVLSSIKQHREPLIEVAPVLLRTDKWIKVARIQRDSPREIQ